MSSMGELTFFLGLQVKQNKDGIFISQDKYVAEILRKFGLSEGKLASTPIDAEKPLLKDSDGEDVDVYTYSSMIGSVMYLTSSRPDIMFAVCACARFQVTLKLSHLNAVKRIFRYLKEKPCLGLWYLKDSPFDLVAYSDSDYVCASLDKKSTTRGCQFFRCRLISWQCKKQTVVATSSTEAEYVAAASGCAQVLWMQNQLLDYGDSPLLGVNTPRSDEDRLKLMKLMVFVMKKDVCDEFELNAARLSKFLLLGDVTRLQALVDKKRIVITEEVVCEILQLNDFEGVICLPNDEIFAGVTRMGYEKPSTKLIFNKAFLSTQWKFFIYTILHSLSQRFNFSKYIFESLIRNVDSSSKFYMYPRFIQLIIQSNIADFSKHTNRYISLVLTQKVFANIRRVGKGFLGVETPLFETMLAVRAVDAEEEVQVPAQDDVVQEHVTEEIAAEVVPPTLTSPSPSSPVLPSSPPHQSPSPPQQQAAEGSSHVFQQVLDTCSAFVLRVEGLENANAAQQLEIVQLKARVKKLERLNKVKSSMLKRLKKVGTSQRVKSLDNVENVFNQGRISVDIDQDEGIELVVNQEKDAEIEGRQGDKQGEIYNIDLDHSSKVLSMQEDDTEVQEAVEVVTTAKLITEVVTAAATQVVAASAPILAAKSKTLKIAVAPVVSTRRRKGVVIRDPKEELHADTPAKTPTVKDKGKRILIEDPKPIKKKDQVEMDAEYAKKLQEELDKENKEAYKQIDWNAAFDHNTEGYKMEFFKGKTYDQILLIFQARFDANLKFLFKSREEIEKEDEEIIKSINETPAQKAAKRRKLSEEAQEADDLRIVKERFSTKKPTNFSDEYLLLTLKTMFGELDEQDAIWRNQKSVHGLVLVKRWKLLNSCGVHVIILSTVQLLLLVERRLKLKLFKMMLLVLIRSKELSKYLVLLDIEVATDVVPPTPTSPSPSSPVIPSSPHHQSPCPPQPQAAEGSSHVFQQETANAAQQLEIVKLKARVKKLEKHNKGRISVDMDQDEGIKLVVDQEKDAEIEGRQADKQTEIYNIDLDHSSKVLSMQEYDTEVVAASTPIFAAKPKVLKIAAAPAVSTRKRKGVVIRDLEEELHIDTPAETLKYAKKLQEELNKEHEEAYKNIDWNAAFDHVQAKETQYIKRYHGFKKKPQSESEARKNMISYLKNTEGYKMEFFKGKTYDQILPIFQARFDANLKFLFKSREKMEKEDEEIIKSINETPAQKAAKRRKLSEEAQEADDLKKRLEIVQDEDDDVFVEATPLAQKVPVVDYQVVVIDNKPKYKIIRADDTHQFYISFTTLLKNFDREDMETL
nr:uncharacterized mitochondrial protein AtMg00810-like [Tanacetum cinerariifolium]